MEKAKNGKCGVGDTRKGRPYEGSAEKKAGANFVRPHFNTKSNWQIGFDNFFSIFSFLFSLKKRPPSFGRRP